MTHRVWVSANKTGFLFRKPAWNVWGKKSWIRFYFTLSVFSHLQCKTWYRAKPTAQKDRSGALPTEKWSKMYPQHWWCHFPDEKHWKAFPRHYTLLLTYHLSRANLVCEPCKANLCQCSCQGFCICLCTLECVSWLLGLGCSGVHSQAVKRKLPCPSRKVSGKAVGGFENWFLSTPSLCRAAAQGITVALDQTS